MKGKVKCLAISHINGRSILRDGDEVTSSDVTDFKSLVKNGAIEPDEETKKLLSSKGSDKTENESGLLKLKKNELQGKCKELEIEFKDSDNKEDLVAMIEEKLYPKIKD